MAGLLAEAGAEARIDGAQAGPRYPGGVTVRFARVKGCRAGKSAISAGTIDTVRGLQQA